MQKFLWIFQITCHNFLGKKTTIAAMNLLPNVINTQLATRTASHYTAYKLVGPPCGIVG